MFSAFLLRLHIWLKSKWNLDYNGWDSNNPCRNNCLAIRIASGVSVRCFNSVIDALLSLSASMFIISNTGTVAPGAYVTLGVMTLIVAGLAAIVGVLAYTK